MNFRHLKNSDIINEYNSCNVINNIYQENLSSGMYPLVEARGDHTVFKNFKYITREVT